MPELKRAAEPFVFFSRLNLPELTGLKAATIPQLLGLIKEAPGAAIYHHTHSFLQQHDAFVSEPLNDFAYWVSSAVGDARLGEKLAAIDTVQFSSIHEIREAIVSVIEGHLKESPLAQFRFSGEGEEFHFVKSVSFIYSLGRQAYTLKEFLDILKQVSVDCIYFHFIEAKLRLDHNDNDFSSWIRLSLGDEATAGLISRLDPYTQSLDGLKNSIVSIVEKRIGCLCRS